MVVTEVTAAAAAVAEAVAGTAVDLVTEVLNS